MASALRRFDTRLMLAAISLLGIGLLTLASSDKTLFARQIVWIAAAMVLMLGLPTLNLRALLSYKWIIIGIYASTLALLVLTNIIAPTISGTRSWIVIGPVQIQPSEFMKAALILLMSSFFAVRHIAIARMGTVAISFMYFIIPAFFVLLQPDLGTTLVLFAIWFGYLLVSGLPIRRIVAALVLFAIVGAIGWFGALADYQKARISALFNPEIDPLGVNYNVAQSKIAIGSGGLFGKGFGQGTQVRLGFLPAAQTDFIFAAFVEEWGIFGGAVLIALFLFMLHRILSLGMQSANNFGRFVALGTTIMLFTHFVINMGSALGLLPVIGIGLPLVSYGGSNLLTTAMLIGIIQGITERRVGF